MADSKYIVDCFKMIMIVFSVMAGGIAAMPTRAQDDCVVTFAEFAMPDMEATSFAVVQPLDWQLEADAPQVINGIHSNYSLHSIAASRVINGEQEIWILSSDDDDIGWLVYHPESHEWTRVSRYIAQTGFHTQDLFVVSDGSLWGRVRWWSPTTNPPRPDGNMMPVLSRFNENTRRFEVPAGMLKIPFPDNDFYQTGQQALILVGQQNDFWIVVDTMGIVHYDVTAERAELRLALPELHAGGAALAPDGTLYFLATQGLSTRLGEAPLQDVLFQFRPDTDEIQAIDIPDVNWLYWGGIYTDSQSQLWFGIAGFRDVQGNWHIQHPYPDVFSNSKQYMGVFAPLFALESSDGRFWYNRDNDGSYSGIAWYDPEENAGCLLTGDSVSIIEDGNHHLWIVDAGKLYRRFPN